MVLWNIIWIEKLINTYVFGCATLINLMNSLHKCMKIIYLMSKKKVQLGYAGLGYRFGDALQIMAGMNYGKIKAQIGYDKTVSGWQSRIHLDLEPLSWDHVHGQYYKEAKSETKKFSAHVLIFYNRILWIQSKYILV